MLAGSSELFSPAGENIFLGHCSISPLYRGAAAAIQGFAEDMAAGGVRSLPRYFDVIPRLHENAAGLLKTSPENISLVNNTAEALCLIANGYPFQSGDQVISYVHEYPSNHYPWVLQERRGVELVLLTDSDPLGTLAGVDRPKGWSMAELADRVTDRTRMIAISHVQFSSGYAADLKVLGDFCREREIDLIIDCAQSLGCLPVYPEEYNIAALASSGWKWLMGPWASALLYTREDLRARLTPTMAGPGLMKQGLDYLDHRWNPHTDGRMFEYSTLAWDHAAGLNAVLSDVFGRFSLEDIRAEVFRLQDIFVAHLDPSLIRPIIFADQHRSGIMSLIVSGDTRKIMQRLAEQGVIMTGPVGYLRLAPHFYQQDEQMVRAAGLLNTACSV
ncbi:MAG: aminotransferase class V-fold PLP-dependent enzyme [Desulfoprunum sp.]|nr:aminotransferase class V-fold PLP-dependent enzyme [Desulfoprunum sp.]